MKLKEKLAKEAVIAVTKGGDVHEWMEIQERAFLAGFEAAREMVAAKANECCYRSDGWEESLKQLGEEEA